MHRISKRACLLKEFEVVEKSHAERLIFALALMKKDSFEDVIDDHIEYKRHSQVFASVLEIR